MSEITKEQFTFTLTPDELKKLDVLAMFYKVKNKKRSPTIAKLINDRYKSLSISNKNDIEAIEKFI